MKKTNPNESDEMRPEYDFASMKDGVRGKYAQRFRSGSNIVVIGEDIAEAFPTEEAVNEALRGILKIARAVRGEGEPTSHGVKSAPSESKSKRHTRS